MTERLTNEEIAGVFLRQALTTIENAISAIEQGDEKARERHLRNAEDSIGAARDFLSDEPYVIPADREAWEASHESDEGGLS